MNFSSQALKMIKTSIINRIAKKYYVSFALNNKADLSAFKEKSSVRTVKVSGK